MRTLTNTSPRSTLIIEDNNGKQLADDTKLLNRWIEYCNDLYNHIIDPDTNVLSNTDIFNEKYDTKLSLFDTKFMNAINTLKESKSPGIDNIPSALDFINYLKMEVILS